MSKKEIKISNEEMMELMGLKRTSDSNDDSDKTAIELATEKYSKEELAVKKACFSFGCNGSWKFKYNRRTRKKILVGSWFKKSRL